MRVYGFLFLACLSLTSPAALAQTMQPTSGDAMSGMTMPTCKEGDPVVGVSMVTKMYMTADQMKAKFGGLPPAQKQGIIKNQKIKLMCKSEALAMGAKPLG
jgi:hypothetical protein